MSSYENGVYYTKLVTTGNDGISYEDTFWDDIRFPANAVRVGAARPATEETYRGGIVLAFDSAADNSIYFNCQLPHAYKIGTDLDAHIHVVLPTSGAGAGVENVKFDFTYSWCSIGGSFPAESTISVTRDVQNDSADDHILIDIGNIPYSAATLNGGNGGVSMMLICSLTRDTTVANNYADDVYLVEADFHYQIDAPGSRDEYVK